MLRESLTEYYLQINFSAATELQYPYYYMRTFSYTTSVTLPTSAAIMRL